MESKLTRGGVKRSFLLKHSLVAQSTPQDWMDAFWPRTNDLGKFSITSCTTNSNLKAGLMNAGEGGSTYTQFEHFTVDEIHRNIGIQIAHGLAPTRVE
jgi:hypothetical protein